MPVYQHADRTLARTAFTMLSLKHGFILAVMACSTVHAAQDVDNTTPSDAITAGKDQPAQRYYSADQKMPERCNEFVSLSFQLSFSDILIVLDSLLSTPTRLSLLIW